MSAVQARVHYALKQELQLIAGLIRDYTDPDYTYEPEEGGPQAKKADYSMVEVVPVSDPNAATLSQRVVQYQAVIQLAQMAPQIYDLPFLHRQMLEVLGIKHASKIVPMEDDQKPHDPVTENQDALKGKPLKAFSYQDHEAHIKVHTSAMQDPIVMQLIGQNPQAQAIMGAMQAHIAEHVGFAYRNKIELALGVPLPSSEDELPEEMEKEISRLMAEAAVQVLQESKAQTAQQQAQQNQQDPIIQMQQQELQIKQQELQLKQQKLQQDAQLQAQKMQQDAQLQAQKMQVDGAARIDELNLKKQEMETRAELEMVKLTEGAKRKDQELRLKEQLEGTKIGVDIAKTKHTMNKKTKE
jgi:hypothetical protein